MINIFNRIVDFILNSIVNKIYDKFDAILMLQAKEILNSNWFNNNVSELSEYEFKVFSQWGEDGIIQYLISKIEIKNKFFIEFGVENYTESNTRFLIKNNNWSGLVIDGNKKCIDYIKNDPIYWKYDLTAINSFITKDNINNIFLDNNIQGEIGLLSIDIDGNDYWIWKNIEVVKPLIVICEYNSIFGKDFAITIPYKENFNRTKEHFSNLYFGASLKALYLLAKEKGYKFLGTTSAGNDAFFVRSDVAQCFSESTLDHGFTNSKFRESRNLKNKLTFINGDERLNIIKNMPIFDIEKQKIFLINELFNI